MVRELGEPVRQQVVLDAGQGCNTFCVTHETTVAPRDWLVIGEQSRHGNVYVAKLPRHPGRSLDHEPCLDDTAAQTRPHYCCDRRVLTARRSKMHMVGVKRSRVANWSLREPELFSKGSGGRGSTAVKAAHLVCVRAPPPRSCVPVRVHIGGWLRLVRPGQENSGHRGASMARG